MRTLMIDRAIANKLAVPLSLSDLIGVIEDHKTNYIFIKNRSSIYQHCNDNFLKLMGVSTRQQLINHDDYALCSEKQKVLMYQDHDQQAFAEEKPLIVNGAINPIRNHLTKEMKGTLYPIYHKQDKPEYVLGIFQSITRIVCLNWDTIFKLHNDELDQLLIHNRYKVTIAQQVLTLSKREIQLIINLVKGLHAGEISEELDIKQTTVESYLVNLKNKLGVNTRRQIIDVSTSNNLLEQIII